MSHFIPFPLLFTERLALRQMTISDDNEVFFLRSDPEVMEFLDTPIATSAADAREYIIKINNGILHNDWILWGIENNGSSKLIGSICLWNFNEEKTVAEIGYVLHPDQQGRGLMQEALLSVITYGFITIRLEKIVAHLHPGNKRSVRLLEKNNFMYEKQSGNMVVFALTRPLL